MNSTKETGALDLFRLVAAFLIVAIHTSPLSSLNDTADFVLTRIIARTAVPFFFMVTGYFLFPHMKADGLKKIGAFLKKIIFLFMGASIHNNTKKASMKKSIAGLCIATALLLAEGLLLHSLSVQRHDSMYIFLLPCMYFLFLILLQAGGKSNKTLRNVSMLVYVIHPWIILLTRGLSKVLKLQKLLIENSFIHYLAAGIISFAAAFVLAGLWGRLAALKPLKNRRAWVEIDMSALLHNARVLTGLLPKQCQLMAVVKANAYGHGDIRVAKALYSIGVCSFAVATLAEGIHLRKNGIKGDILILGYTNPKDADCLAHYRLTQTVVDYPYAKALNDSGRRIRVHIKIDTGMHRLGIDFSNLSDIQKIFMFGNLQIDGVYSHLCVSDSLTNEDKSFTELQIERFFKTTDILKSKGYRIGKLHIQASYGILNYPGLPCDYARAGIVLYGVLSNNRKTHTEIGLQPVLSLKARIATVRKIASGESVCYGRQFISETDMKIATITIGYSDGIPRNLCESDAYVLLHSQRAPVIGRICMDQFVIDVSKIDNAEPDDVVTIIGKDGNEIIRCEDVAEKCGTITNEILSRMGERLERIY